MVWVAHDTPVDSEDRADVDFVTAQVEQLFPHLAAGTVVLISAQLPVGTAAKPEADDLEGNDESNRQEDAENLETAVDPLVGPPLADA